MLDSMWLFFSRFPHRTVEFDGVLAGITSAVPERSLPNSVLYREEDALLRALDELGTLYDEAGIEAWTVWVPEHHQRAKDALAEAGHSMDADPAAMVVRLDEAEPPREDDPLPDPEPRLEDMGRINDLAYGTGDAFQRMAGEGPAHPAHTYITRVDGEPAAVVVTQDVAGDCSLWCVASVPEVRGRGLVAGLIRRSLADGRKRGCDISTLQATKLGQPVYEKLGYRAFGAMEMWERRTAA
jgi:ribosomal protein S18 acetylase RimI-like enzyme